MYINLSIKDIAQGPKSYFPVVLIHNIIESLKEDNLSINKSTLARKDKTAEFILSPTCPLFGGSTVVIMMTGIDRAVHLP